MRLQIAAALLLTLAIVPDSTSQTPGPAHEAGKPAVSDENAYSPQLRSELVGLRDAALSDDYAYQQVAHLTENIGPRASGSAQAGAAVQYVADELRKLGLVVRLEEVRVPQWMTSSSNKIFHHFTTFSAFSYAEIVFCILSSECS